MYTYAADRPFDIAPPRHKVKCKCGNVFTFVAHNRRKLRCHECGRPIEWRALDPAVFDTDAYPPKWWRGIIRPR